MVQTAIDSEENKPELKSGFYRLKDRKLIRILKDCSQNYRLGSTQVKSDFTLRTHPDEFSACGIKYVKVRS